MTVHRREIRVRHDHLMAECLQVLRDPLTLGRRLEQHAHARSSPEHHRHPRVVAIRRSTISPSLRQDSTLAFLLVQVDGTILDGWSSPCASRARFSNVERKATTSLRRPAASSYLRAPSSAHHSFAAEWDSTKYRDFTGVLRKLDWQTRTGISSWT
jgi:hypothetical protein